MTQPTRTPAPWTYNHTPQMGYYNIEDAKGNIIGRFFNEADAIKATAAPELLEALKLAHAALSGSNMNMNVVEKKVKSAIAKAEVL